MRKQETALQSLIFSPWVLLFCTALTKNSKPEKHAYEDHKYLHK